MVFSSVPLYLDPPNWQQHPNQQLHVGGTGHDQNHQHLIPPPPVQQPQSQPHHQVGIGGGGPGAPPIRPNSMAERARLAKIPPPEAPLKCPRCESTNTKFCYFNNYSLSQPRHFCKTCRRYWTRGGALRNVPVGGGCRRNKRSSSKSSAGGGGSGSSSSKSSSLSSPTGIAAGGERHMDLISPTITGIPSGGGAGGGISFMASLQNIAQLGMGNLGLTFGGSLNTPTPNPLGGLGVGAGGLAGGDHHQLEFPQLNQSPHVQFPNFLGGFEIPGSSNTSGGGAGGGIYTSFHNDHDDQEQVNNFPKSSPSSTMISHLAPVKMESEQGLSIAKQLMGISSSSSGINPTANNQFWGGTINGNTASSMWTDLSGLNSSSATHLL